MADNEVEEIYEEEAPLTAEELFEQHKAEIDAAFEEKGFFRRLSDMFKGLSKPHATAEYKLARTELQRLAAPILAVLLPVLGVTILIVVTAVTNDQGESVTVEIAQNEPEQEPEPEPEPEPPDQEETPPDQEVEVTVDTPSVNTPTEMVDHSPPTNEPISVKPAEQDTVAIIKSPVQMKSMASSRNPGVRGRYTNGGAGYGDKNTEAAVMKALRWLKHTQQSDGSWTSSKPPSKSTSNTALAILAYLAHGETPSSPEFGYTVEKAMQYLINAFQVDGKGVPRFKGSDGNEYAFLIATYALGETYGMTKNPNTKEVALKAMQRIINGQSATGGWDYKINKDSQRDDLSFAGWALQALKACKMAGLHPDGLDECIKKAIRCLKTRSFKGGGFGYCAGHGPSGLTATGCLCMQLLGYANEKEVSTALESMREWMPAFEAKGGFKAGGPLPGANPQYYCYYASQCKYQAGMKAGALPVDLKTWQTWNAAMKKLYPNTIKTLPEKIADHNGKMQEMGFWDCGTDGTCKSAGHTMTTCLCALQLMVYYRYLPTTQTKAGEAESHDDTPAETKTKKDEVDVDVDI